MKKPALLIALLLILSGCANQQRVTHFEDHPLEKHVGRFLHMMLDKNDYQTNAVHYLIWKNPVVNAFISGDNPPVLMITTGLLDSLNWDKDEDILAAAMAHELAHFRLNHLKKRKAVSYATSAVFTAAGLFVPGLGFADLVVNPTVTNAFGRGQELDADREAVEILRKAGWKNASDTVIKTLEWAESMRPAGGGVSLWSSHPPNRDRIENIQAAYPTRP